MSPRPVLAALALALVNAGAASPAQAKIPDPRFCTLPTLVLGSTSGAPLPSCSALPSGPATRTTGCRLVLRDINNAPLRGEVVTLDFSATPIRLLADDSPGVTVDCVARTLRGVTDAQGVVVFHPRFCGDSAGGAVQIQADGFVLDEVPARSTDVDGDGTAGIADFARVGRNFLQGTLDPATDFDPCSAGSEGRTTLADFAIFAAELLRDVRGEGCP